MYVCKYVCTHLCMYVCMYVRMYACVYVGMYVCIYLCIYVCVYVSMYVDRHVYTHTHESDRYLGPKALSLYCKGAWTLWATSRLLPGLVESRTIVQRVKLRATKSHEA